jgi:hypothetical protein
MEALKASLAAGKKPAQAAADEGRDARGRAMHGAIAQTKPAAKPKAVAKKRAAK